MSEHHPKVIRYQLSILNAVGVPHPFYDADTPFPTVVAGHEISINGEMRVVKKVSHELSDEGSELTWLTSLHT